MNTISEICHNLVRDLHPEKPQWIRSELLEGSSLNDGIEVNFLQGGLIPSCSLLRVPTVVITIISQMFKVRGHESNCPTWNHTAGRSRTCVRPLLSDLCL